MKGEKGRSFGQLPVEERWLTIARSLPVTYRDDGGVPASEPVAFLADAGPASRPARKFASLHCRLTLTDTNGVVGDMSKRCGRCSTAIRQGSCVAARANPIE